MNCVQYVWGFPFAMQLTLNGYVLVQRLNGEWKYSSMYIETYVVAQLVETLHYMLEGCRFNS
jgi:hypothetical protein